MPGGEAEITISSADESFSRKDGKKTLKDRLKSFLGIKRQKFNPNGHYTLTDISKHPSIDNRSDLMSSMCEPSRAQKVPPSSFKDTTVKVKK
jgi:hypothetical protein